MLLIYTMSCQCYERARHYMIPLRNDGRHNRATYLGHFIEHAHPIIDKRLAYYGIREGFEDGLNDGQKFARMIVRKKLHDGLTTQAIREGFSAVELMNMYGLNTDFQYRGSRSNMEYFTPSTTLKESQLLIVSPMVDEIVDAPISVTVVGSEDIRNIPPYYLISITGGEIPFPIDPTPHGTVMNFIKGDVRKILLKNMIKLVFDELLVFLVRELRHFNPDAAPDVLAAQELHYKETLTGYRNKVLVKAELLADTMRKYDLDIANGKSTNPSVIKWMAVRKAILNK